MQGVGQVTAASFKSAVSAVSGLFHQKTQEAIYADETGLRQGQVSLDGSLWRFQSGDTVVEYDADRAELTEWFGNGRARIEGLGTDESENYYYEKLTYHEVTQDGFVLEENYEKGQLSSWGYYYNELPVFKVNSSDQNPGSQSLPSNGHIEIFTPVEIKGPEPEPKTYTVPVYFNFYFDNGQITRTETRIEKSAVQNPAIDKELYVLVNGILNDKNKSEGSPAYLLNLKQDLIKQSSLQGAEAPIVAAEDIVTAPTFFTSGILKLLGLHNLPAKVDKFMLNLLSGNFFALAVSYAVDQLQDALINGGKDVFSWLAEAADPEAHAWLANEVKSSVDSFFDLYGQANRARETVAVGYSGGFVPLVETLARDAYDPSTQTGYNVKTLVALGAATIDAEQALKDLMVKMVEAEGILRDPLNQLNNATETIFEGLNNQLIQTFGGTGFGIAAIERILSFLDRKLSDQAYQEYQNSIQPFYNLIDQTFNGYALAGLTGSTANMLVNVYGTRDMLANIGVNDVKIGGYRNQMGDFTLNDPEHQLFNIEIIGASHFDYMRREDSWVASLLNLATGDIEWNKTVSTFVADLILNADDPDRLNRFLERKRREQQAAFENGRWVITLPGYEGRA